VIPKTSTYSKIKDQAAATRAKLSGEKKAGAGAAASEEPASVAGQPNGKKHKPNGHATNGVVPAAASAPPKILADDDPSTQLEMEMRQAQRGQDGDVDMTG
jgi:hypothetical protein